MTLSDLVRPARTAAIGDSDTPHLFERYRDAMPGIGIACPAQRLQTPATTRWVKKHGLSVAAYSSSELALAISSGIEPSRLVAYGEQARWGPIRCAVNAGVRQFVVDACEQVEILERYAKRRQQVLLDVNTEHVGDAVAAICDSAHLDLVGLHFEQDQGSSGAHRYAVAVDAMVALLTLIHVRRGLIATRLSLAGPVWNSPRAVAAVIETATEDSCARHHFPRPSLAFTPR
jgi:diaminopimelate decarboxylase